MRRMIPSVLTAVVGNALWVAVVWGYAWIRLRGNRADWATLMLWFALGLVGSSLVWLYARARDHGYQNVARKKADVQGQLRELTEKLRGVWNDTGMHVRASVMLPNRIRTKRKVLFNWNFESVDKDADLQLDIQSGLSGLAWFYGRTHAEGNLQRLHKEISGGKQDKTSFLLRREEALRVRPSVDSMMAVRIEDPRRRDMPIGCVCVDSDRPLRDTRFKDAEVSAIVEAQAAAIAQILAK